MGDFQKLVDEGIALALDEVSRGQGISSVQLVAQAVDGLRHEKVLMRTQKVVPLVTKSELDAGLDINNL